MDECPALMWRLDLIWWKLVRTSGSGGSRGSADWQSAVPQVGNLRYGLLRRREKEKVI